LLWKVSGVGVASAAIVLLLGGMQMNCGRKVN
jgi:hypothetical protein